MGFLLQECYNCYMKKYLVFVHSVFKERKVYRTSFYLFLISEIITLFAMVYIWKAIFEGSNETLINGFNYLQMVFYVVFSTLSFRLIYTDVDRSIAMEIMDGSISNYLIRPVSYFGKVISTALGSILFTFLYVIIPFLSVFFFLYQEDILSYGFTITNISLFVITILLSLVVSILLDFVVGLFSFYVNYMWGFLLMKETLFRLASGALFPLTFLSPSIVSLLQKTPFYYMNFAPVSILLNHMGVNQALNIIFILVVWILLLSLIAYRFWKKAIYHMTIAGG